MITYADIEEVYERDAQLKRDDVQRLETWQRQQPHLPPPLHPIEVALFLIGSSYSHEAAKKHIDAYYTFRTHCPEFFADWDPFGAEVQGTIASSIVSVLPDRTPQGDYILYIRPPMDNLSQFNYNAINKLTMMVGELAMKRRGWCMGYVCIVDVRGGQVGHLLKCPIASVRKAFAFLQSPLPIRTTAVHFVNSVPFMDRVLAFFRPFLGKQLQNAFHAHFGDNATIYKYVPKDILPIECGGEKFSVTDYYNQVTRKEIEAHAEYLKMVARRLVDESKRPGSPMNFDHLFGVEGTFKYLNID